MGKPGGEARHALGLRRWPDSVGHDGRTLDLATGEVITKGWLGAVAVIRDAKDRLGGYEHAAHALDTVGWTVQEIRLGLDGVPDTIIAKRR